MRSQARAAHAPTIRAAAKPIAGEERRAWIEALFGDHLPRTRPERERAIEVLVGDAGVWRMLHQVRHSMAETSATIERLARAALEDKPLRAA
ncbi:hypothetical protein [Novosphingobium sp. Gsoil 351]|uniref:hypothetical protein n=1 Tax=Novosphingobium sp. Gsoil 351 TaxID=2675225 RepID=UPI001E383102|nr:hypothetical protein [Novosphingobium sp. Gsoil 351]